MGNEKSKQSLSELYKLKSELDEEKIIAQNNLEKKIKKLKEEQDVQTFLELIYDLINNNKNVKYAKIALESLKEKTIISKYKIIKAALDKKNDIIEKVIKNYSQTLKEDCLRKLLIIFLFCDKENNKDFDCVLEKFINHQKLKEILFNILIDYYKEFECILDLNKNINSYINFINYSLKEKNPLKALKALNYFKYNLIQLQIPKKIMTDLYNIFVKKSIINTKLNEFDELYEILKGFINYQTNKIIIKLPKEFWDKYCEYVFSIEKDKTEKISKLLKIYKLLLLYIELYKLDKDIINCKKSLAEKIHELVEDKIKNDNIGVKDKLDFLFNKDPYYIYDNYKEKRNPEIFDYINILDLNEKKDIDYFKKLNIENIYNNLFISYHEFLKVIFQKVKNVEDFNIIIKLIQINLEKNKTIYIEILIDKYITFNDEDLSDESFKNFLDKVINYGKVDQIKSIESIAKTFKSIYIQIIIERADKISNLLNIYYAETFKKEINNIQCIFKLYDSKNENEENLWNNKRDEIIKFIDEHKSKADILEIVKEIQLFNIIYSKFNKEKDENKRFDNAKKLFDECKIIFIDIYKGNSGILAEWQKKFREINVYEEFKLLKNYYQIESNEDIDTIVKNILIFTKKNNYKIDIECILYFLNIFGPKKTELSRTLETKLKELNDEKNLNLKKLIEINNFLEKKEIYINNGKDDSSLILFIRLLNNRENEIKLLKENDVYSAIDLMDKINPDKNNSLGYKDIVIYQSCIEFLNDIKQIKQITTDENLLDKVKDKFKKNNINDIKNIFDKFFNNYENIKYINSTFDDFENLYLIIKDILNNSKITIEFFKTDFKVYDNNNNEKEMIIKDLSGLIELKEKIKLNIIDLSFIINFGKEKIKERKDKMEKFIEYVENIQKIIKYITKLKNKGCPFLINIAITISNNSIIYELINSKIKYNEIIKKLKQYCDIFDEYLKKFYKENEYFRFIYDKQLYKIYKKIQNKDKDINSYIRFITNIDSIKDAISTNEIKYKDLNIDNNYFKNYIENYFDIISDYIKNIFETNNISSLETLYNSVKIDPSQNLSGIFISDIQNIEINNFIIKVFFKLTNSSPVAQNILMANKNTTKNELFSFMYRALKCRFNTLFIISISKDFSNKNIKVIIDLINEINSEQKDGNKNMKYIKPCILFITENSSTFSEELLHSTNIVKDFPEYLKNEIIEYNHGNDNIYNNVNIYTSDSNGLGKSYLIRKKIKDNNEKYYYLSIGEDITKIDLYKKLKKLIKDEIKDENKVGIHLDLYYTRNIDLMNYFLFSVLISKIYQINDKILYIPNNFSIYVEIPNGPKNFLDDYPLLKLFNKLNLSFNNSLPLDIHDDSLYNKIFGLNKEKNNEELKTIFDLNKFDTYVEKNIFMNIITHLYSTDLAQKDNYNEKIKRLAECFTEAISKNTLIEKININEEINIPLIFKTKTGYEEIDISDEEIKGKNIEYYLSNLKRIISSEKSIEEIKGLFNNYAITPYNYRKMILILFRIFTNIPTILIGETGVGKTSLIKQLFKFLKSEYNIDILIINDITCEIKGNELIKIIENTEKKLSEDKNNLIYIYFDEMNISSRLSTIKEIFLNHSLNGKKINENIRFIGACKSETGINLVDQFSNSLIYYTINFNNLKEDEIKNYIVGVVNDLFSKEENEFLENVIEAIYSTYKFTGNNESRSNVTLRDLKKFKIAYKFYNEYCQYKTEYLYGKKEKHLDDINIEQKIISFSLALYVTYFIKIFEGELEYLSVINRIILKLVKEYRINKLYNDLYFNANPFKTLIKKEEEFLINQMDLKVEDGIGINNSLKENIFLMFFSIYSHIPLIILGDPGTSKTLSLKLILRFMRGEFSNSNFLKNYPSIVCTYFQEAEINTPEKLNNFFKIAEEKLNYCSNDKKIISLLVLDGLNFSGKNNNNSLNILKSKFETQYIHDNDNNKTISFIGINIQEINNSIKNRALFLKINNIYLDDIQITCEGIAKSYSEKLYKKFKNREYEFLGKTFYNYKRELKKLKNDFFKKFYGMRDFIHSIKIISSEIMENNMTENREIIDKGIIKSLYRNLNGLNLLDEQKENILNKYIQELNKEIKFDDIKTLKLIKDNIISRNSRFLLLITETSMFDFLINIIKKELESKLFFSKNKKYNFVNFIGSPFKEDIFNNSYKEEMIIKIKNSISEGKIIILNNLEYIYSAFYDLFNQNYIFKNGKKYYKLFYGGHIQKLAYINENTKIIILVDENKLKEQKLSFLSRFEKYIIKYDNFLDNNDIKKSKDITKIIESLVDVKGINYDLDNILVNINENIIKGYVYSYKNRKNNTIQNILEDKIIPIMPQDVFFTLPFTRLNKEERILKSFIKKKYLENKFYDIYEYLESDKIRKENILLVYTFSKIGLIQKERFMERIVSEINSLNKFKQVLQKFYKEKKYNYLILRFEKNNTNHINFFISEINEYKKMNKIKDDNTKNFIFIIHITRDFNFDKNNKISTLLITNENIKQLFIDDINRSNISIKDIEGKHLNDYFNNNKCLLDAKKNIVESIYKFYGKYMNDQIGNYKGINHNNFLKEIRNFFENNNDIINNIKKVILNQLNEGTEKIINLIIDNNLINNNTTDFISTILKCVNNIFIQKLEKLLYKSEKNNFLVTYFMLHLKENDASNIISSHKYLNDYTFKYNDKQLITNKLFTHIEQEYLNYLKLDNNETSDNSQINIKIYYKIPAFFNIYTEIKKYIVEEKLAFSYRESENNLRYCKSEFNSKIFLKQSDDLKEFSDNLYIKLLSQNLINKAIEYKKATDENFIQFTELFLNDYITFYLVNLYDNKINDIVINDIPHKIILLLLDLKINDLNEKHKYNPPLRKIISKILWIEANSDYIKNILDLFNILSDIRSYNENEKNSLFEEILIYISKGQKNYELKEYKLIKVNYSFYIIITSFIKCLLDNKSIKIANSSNDNLISYFRKLEKCLKEMKYLDIKLKLEIKEIHILKELIIIYKTFIENEIIKDLDICKIINILKKGLSINEKNGENEIKLLCNNLKFLIKYIKESLSDKINFEENKINKIYYSLITNIFLNEIQRVNNLDYTLFILNEFLLKDEKLFIQSIPLLEIILKDFVSPNINLFHDSFKKLEDEKLKILESKMDNDWIKETIFYLFEKIGFEYLENCVNFYKEKYEKENYMLLDLQLYFGKYNKFLEISYKNSEITGNILLKKLFLLAFQRVYLKTFLEYIDNNFLQSNEIDEIIKEINGEKQNKFRDMLSYYVYKIINHKNGKDIQNLFKDEIIAKYRLENYRNFKDIESDKTFDENNKMSIIKENNKSDLGENENYPYYKYFLYSDYPDLSFIKNKFNEINNEKYLLTNLLLNDEENNNINFYKEFLCVNFVIKSMNNYYSHKISKNEAKKLSLEDTYLYKSNKKIFNDFIEIIDSNVEINLSKERSLSDFLFDESTGTGKLYKKLYNKYAKIQNDFIRKINKLKNNRYEYQEINIQEALEENLVVLDPNNKNIFYKIFLNNMFRNFYNSNSTINYNNFNTFYIDFDKIEKNLEDFLITNICILKTDELIEIKYMEEDFINDGLSEFNNNNKIQNLSNIDKKSFIIFYEENLKINLESCLEINEDLQKLIKYINKNKNSNIKNHMSLSNILNEWLPFDINNDLKSFINENKDISMNKLGDLMIFLEKFYFESAMEESKEFYNEKLSEDIKNNIKDYINNKNLLLSKDKISLNIIRFLLCLEKNRNNGKIEIIKDNDNLFEYLSNEYFWEKKIIEDERFEHEIGEYKNFNINIKNISDFYNIISVEYKKDFEKETKNLYEKINLEKKEIKNSIKNKELDLINDNSFQNDNLEEDINDIDYDENFDIIDY